jgi:mRNA interferase MazF
LILSNDAQNSAGQRVLAAPITSSVKRIYAFEAAVSVQGRGCKAMLDQVRCLDRQRLLDKAGRATDEEMKAVDEALRIAFDLI